MSVKELLSNAEIVIGEEELTEKISKGQTLRVKFGVDPTRPDLTFGHMVVFNKLKQFQDAVIECINTQIKNLGFKYRILVDGS